MDFNTRTKKNILLVDDEIDLLLTYAARLEIKGFDVQPAYDGLEAIMKVRQDKPDLILLDLVIPKMNGFEVCQAVRANEMTKHIPIVIITAFSDKISDQKAKECGADDLFIKPFNMEELVVRIKSLLNPN